MLACGCTNMRIRPHTLTPPFFLCLLSAEAMSVVPSKKRVRKATAQSCALHMAPEPTDRQLRIALMMEIAKESGFICQAQTEYAAELATSIASRLVHRSGMSVYQSVAFTIQLFARDAALEIFGATGRTSMSEHHINWKLSTIPECASVLEALMARVPSTSCCAGLTRALRSESEVTSQVLATIMPTLEATWETQAKGGCLASSVRPSFSIISTARYSTFCTYLSLGFQRRHGSTAS